MRLRSNIGLLLLLLSLQGCILRSSPPREVPDSTVIRLLIELQLAGARAELRGDVPPAFRDSLLNAYGVDSIAFRQLMAYYASHPDEAQALYNHVLDSLQEHLARVDTLP